MITLFVYSCDQKKGSVIPENPVAYSQRFLLAVKLEKDYTGFVDTLRMIDLKALSLKLNNDPARKAFWLNMYNALVQVKLQSLDMSYGDKTAFFGQKNISFGTDSLSLDLIENSILRSQTDQNIPEPIRIFQVQNADYRIHFALNCGAGACPPIAFYSPDQLEDQLELAEEVFIVNDAEYNTDSNIVKVSELFKWFEEDFSTIGGVEYLLRKHEVIPDSVSPSIHFEPYDWNILMGNFR